MKVLLIGATGNLGLRLTAALLTHNHSVTVYVRSGSKLASLLPQSTYERLTVIEGDAKDSSAIAKAISTSKSDAVVNCAGVAALAPWGKSDLPAIFRAVVDGVVQAGAERGGPIRTWLLAGQSIMCLPGTNSMLSDYIPVYVEHRDNLKYIQSQPANALDWSLLCPNTMTPESSDFTVPTTSEKGKLVAGATVSPLWQDSWVKHIPLLGMRIWCAMNAMRYVTTLEQNADFIASDLESRESKWSGMTVGIIDPSK